METPEIPQVKIVAWKQDSIPFGDPTIEVLVEICLLHQHATMGSVYLDKPLWNKYRAGYVPVAHIFSYNADYASEILSSLGDISDKYPKVERVGILFPQTAGVTGCKFDAKSIIHTITKSFVQDHKTHGTPGSRGYREKLSVINEVRLIIYEGNGNQRHIDELEEALRAIPQPA